MTENGTPLLLLENISKTFPGVRALNNVSLRLDSGSVHALMGENGAGKSTLMKCLFGVYSRDSGKIYIDGEERSFKSSGEALDGGVAMVHQELNQALDLTVAENMWLGRFPRRIHRLPFIAQRRMMELTDKVFQELGVKIEPDVRCGDLSVSKRQMIEIAKAVSYGSRIIVFDEPTSSLSDEEAEVLFGIIDRLKKKGAGIIYISHKMEEILKICDTVTIMRDGEHIATKSTEGLTTDEIIGLMVGRQLTDRYPKRSPKLGDELLRCDSLSALPIPKSASFTLRAGEILGVAGLEGSGRTELLESIFGMKGASGRMYVNGREVKNKNPRAAIRNGFALLTEERRRNGIFGILSLTENATVSSLKKYMTGPFISDRKRRDATEWCINSMRVKAPGPDEKIENLSGGNQQKIILGRWLLTKPRVLLLDEPTRGIDVGAKYEIYKLITELADEGCGIIFTSSELPELLGLADRIIVMSGGRIAGELDAACASQEKIMSYATMFL